MFVKNGVTDGTFKLYETYASGGPSPGTTLSLDGENVYTGDSGEVASRLNIPGYSRNRDSHPTYDDVYLATGPGAQARVEIGSAATYSSCNNLAILTPTFWTDSQVVVAVQLGSFQPSQPAYLYVTDANGNVNQYGYPITIGQSSQTYHPADTDHDGHVDMTELTAYNYLWKLGQQGVMLRDIISAIGAWKKGS